MKFSINIKQDDKISFTYKDRECNNFSYEKGDDAIYIQLTEDRGLKIIYPNDKYHSQELTYENLLFFKSKKFNFFPEIFEVHKEGDLIVIEIEHVKQNNFIASQNKHWLPQHDELFSKSFLGADIDSLTNINYSILQNGLLPEDEWYKKDKNLINNKIVDFHRFKQFPTRYEIETDASDETLDRVYRGALERYASMGINKWKGRIYEGFRFSKGRSFLGYSSDGIEYDSYRKLNFMYMNKCAGAKVLDIGCNEGFLSFQAAIHGAKSVYGIDITEQDIALACDINQNILKFENVNFEVNNGVDYISKTNDNYDVIILSSVLHQIYRNFEGADDFLTNVSNKCDYLLFETPVNHPLMNIPLQAIFSKLKLFFQHVRLTYIYDAYSSGYRATFACWKA